MSIAESSRPQILLSLRQSGLVLPELVLLSGQFLQLVDTLPFRLKVIELRDGIPLHQPFERAGPLRLHGHRGSQPPNIFHRDANRRPALHDDLLGRVHTRLIFCHLIAKKLLLKPHVLWIALWRGNKNSRACDEGSQARGFDSGGAMLVQSSVTVRPILSRIEFDQHIAPVHDLTILHLYRSNDASLIGLNHLRMAAGNNLPLRRCHDVDSPN
ncbi:MAG: hypothetical protein K0S58_2234 [Nitrospira sp.]|nr:hypothetical protein [Nitrospira sp.]